MKGQQAPIGVLPCPTQASRLAPDQTASNIIANIAVGTRVPIDLIRDGKPVRVTATVGQRPTEEQLAAQVGGSNDGSPSDSATGSTIGTQVLGLTLQPLSPDLARRSNLPATVRGVIITAVESSSDASEKGLRPGFLIMSVNQVPVTSPAQVTAAVDAARRAGRKSVLLLVKSGATPEAFVGIDVAPQ